MKVAQSVGLRLNVDRCAVDDEQEVAEEVEIHALADHFGSIVGDEDEEDDDVLGWEVAGLLLHTLLRTLNEGDDDVMM